jgi:hypothetical protein
MFNRDGAAVDLSIYCKTRVGTNIDDGRPVGHKIMK